jgi:hypothetical protein
VEGGVVKGSVEDSGGDVVGVRLLDSLLVSPYFADMCINRRPQDGNN